MADDNKKITDQSEEFHREFLDDEAADDLTVEQTVKRMKEKGLSQEALDLAYGRPQK